MSARFVSGRMIECKEPRSPPLPHSLGKKKGATRGSGAPWGKVRIHGGMDAQGNCPGGGTVCEERRRFVKVPPQQFSGAWAQLHTSCK
jgi:hypothetical protein